MCIDYVGDHGQTCGSFEYYVEPFPWGLHGAVGGETDSFQQPERRMCNLNVERAPTSQWCGPFVLYCSYPEPPPLPPVPSPPPPFEPPPLAPVDDFCHFDFQEGEKPAEGVMAKIEEGANTDSKHHYAGEYGLRQACPAYLAMTMSCCTPFRTHKPMKANFPYPSDEYEDICMEYFVNGSDCGGTENAYKVMDMCCDYEWNCGMPGPDGVERGWCGFTNWLGEGEHLEPGDLHPRKYTREELQRHLDQKMAEHEERKRIIKQRKKIGPSDTVAASQSRGNTSHPGRRASVALSRRGERYDDGGGDSRQHRLEPPSDIQPR